MYNQDFKYSSPVVNMNMIDQFEGTRSEKDELISIVNEWNVRESMSSLCTLWKKERPIDTSENLLILLYNCQSLRTHFIDLDILVSSYLPQIVVLTGIGKETSRLNTISQYQWESSPGDNSFGGVAILIHRSISSKIVEKDTNLVILEIETSNDKLLIGGIYVPPRTKSPVHIFEKYTSKNFIILGDYNAKHTQWHCHKNNTSGIQLYDWIGNNGCDIVFPDKPTSKRSDSIIDFAISTIPDEWSADVLDEGTSDHYPVLFSSSICIGSNSFFRKTNWKMFNFFLRCVYEYWNTVVYNIHFDSFFVLFSNFSSALSDRCSIFIHNKKFRPPWPPFLVSLARKANKHKRKYRKTFYLYHYDEYRFWNNVYRTEKARYIEDTRQKKLDSMKQGNDLWKTVNKTFKKFTPPFRGLNTSQGLVKDSRQIVEILADHYEQHFSAPKHDERNPIHLKSIEIYEQMSYTPCIPLEPFSIEDVIKQWKKFKPKRSLDSINTSAYLLKNLPSEYFAIITILFNKCAANGTFFQRAKQARGICLSKDGIYPSKDKLRSISLLPNLGKWFERLIVERIEKWCSENGIHIDEQSGFTRNRRLQTRIVSLFEDIRLTTAACNRPVLALFVDFKSAFDCVWYPILMKNLEEMNMPLQLRRWIFEWLQNRSMTITHGNEESRLIDISMGAPQGSILAALLFRLTIHYLPSYIAKVDTHLFADDLTIIVKGALEKRLSENVRYIEKQARPVMKSLEKFSNDYLLSVNISKTKAMMIHSAVTAEQPKVKYKGSLIEYVNNFKFLGVEIGTKLGMGVFINNRIRKVRNIYHLLKKTFRTIPKSEINIRKKLFCAYALPHFIWLFPCWFFFSEKQQANIEHVYCSGLRLVYNLHGWEDHTTLVLSRELSLRDYVLKYWLKFEKHLEESLEGVMYQQTYTAFLIATCPFKSYYRSCGFRKNSKFPKRLSSRAIHSKVDLMKFKDIHINQFNIFKKTSIILEWTVMKYFPRPP